MSDCLCGSGLESDKCCAPYLAGQPVPTAEALLRSRYCAYVMGNFDYIERTSTQEALVDFDRPELESFHKDAKWQGLEITQVTDGGKNDQTGQIDFIFRCLYKGEPHQQREISQFCRKDGLWFYQSSDVNPKAPPLRVVQIGRNDPCTCGSTKKYKKCCGA